MSGLSTLFDPDFYVKRYKLYLANLNLSELETNDLAVENVLELDTDLNVTKKMPIFDITKFGIRDATGTITFNKKVGDYALDFDWYNKEETDTLIDTVNNSIISLINNIGINYYTKAQIDGIILNYYTKS